MTDENNEQKFKDVLTIIKEYLEKNGYAGLVSDSYDCCCGLEDLCPCCDSPLLCIPAYKKTCDKCSENKDECETRAEAEDDFCFTPIKPQGDTNV